MVGLGPGYTRTERVMGTVRRLAAEAGREVEEFTADFGRAMVPIGRLAGPEEMGRLIAVLASDEVSGFVTGTQWIADGGSSRAI